MRVDASRGIAKRMIRWWNDGFQRRTGDLENHFGGSLGKNASVCCLGTSTVIVVLLVSRGDNLRIVRVIFPHSFVVVWRRIWMVLRVMVAVIARSRGVVGIRRIGMVPVVAVVVKVWRGRSCIEASPRARAVELSL
jgi:hypothetical protein